MGKERKGITFISNSRFSRSIAIDSRSFLIAVPEADRVGPVPDPVYSVACTTVPVLVYDRVKGAEAKAVAPRPDTNIVPVSE